MLPVRSTLRRQVLQEIRSLHIYHHSPKPGHQVAIIFFLQSTLKPYLFGRNVDGILWILTPINVNGNHWGLLCLNMEQQQAFYKDGLRQNHPSNLPGIVENLMKAISCSSDTKWNTAIPIERFGIPKKPLFW